MAHDKSIHLEAASTMAVIASSKAPLLFLNADLLVIAGSLSFCTAFQIEPTTIRGQHLSELGAGEWDVPQLSSLLKATAAGFAEIESYEMDLKRAKHETRNLVLNAHKLEYGDQENVRILLSVTDMTDARAAEIFKDNLLREKAVLLQEVQHRVANSLQIIASVLMQSARRVQSEEARGYLQNAHHRVLSIAAVQQQLAASQIGDVKLEPYLTQLCESLGASMIHDKEKLSISVMVDQSVTSSTVSVSLGLIVTELVINSLKHGFPEQRGGSIVVAYSSAGDDWSLSVSDDGVGMPAAEHAKAGLGTSIVQALTKQLLAEVSVADARPGTAVVVAHRAGKVSAPVMAV